jgi:hypothetical protein
MAQPGLLAWIDRREKGYVAGIINDLEAEPVIREFGSAKAAYDWVSAEAEARGVPIDWLGRTPPDPPSLTC